MGNGESQPEENMAFAVKNLVTKAFVMKFVELVFVFIVFMMFRVGDSGNMFHWGTGFMSITNSPSTISPPPTTTTTTTATTTTTTTITTPTNQKNQFDLFLDPH